MLQNNVNAVLITDYHKPIGVINDRDILREVVEQKRDLSKTLVKDLKFTPLIILESDESMISAMKLMSEKGIKRAAMVKNGQLIGMLTEEAAKKAAVELKATAK